MLKLKRYVKPYLGILLLGIALLFGQAMLELTLPNYMSNIVNVGLQQGGITQTAPEMISKDSMDLMQMLMPQQDKELVQQAYTTLDQAENQDEDQHHYNEDAQHPFAHQFQGLPDVVHLDGTQDTVKCLGQKMHHHITSTPTFRPKRG